MTDKDITTTCKCGQQIEIPADTFWWQCKMCGHRTIIQQCGLTDDGQWLPLNANSRLIHKFSIQKFFKWLKDGE